MDPDDKQKKTRIPISKSLADRGLGPDVLTGEAQGRVFGGERVDPHYFGEQAYRYLLSFSGTRFGPG